MPASFTTRQLAVIASVNKVVEWLFRVTDNQAEPVTYYWSTGTVVAGTGSLNVGAQDSPGTWTDSEWNAAHTFKIINFQGITLRRSKSEYGIHAPNDVSFSIINTSNTLAASNFKGGIVRIALAVDDGLGKQIIGSWRFVIKSASPYNQQIDVTCEDFLQQYLRGTYPNTRLVSDIFKADTDNTIIDDNIVVPEVYGEAYIPLRSVFTGGARYYLLGPSTGKTYTVSEVRQPRAIGKLKWTLAAGDDGPFAMTQATKTAADSTTWQVFQPITAASVSGGAADSPCLWENGDTFYDLPTKFSEVATVSVTSPADVIRRVLINMGISDRDLNGPSFDTARTTFASWVTTGSPNGLKWNFAFWYQEDRAKVLSRLLAMCHSCLVIGEQIELQVLSKTSVKTITSVEVTKPSEDAPASFKYTDSLAERLSDSGYMTWQQTGESQDQFLKYLIPAVSSTDYPGSATVEITAVQDSVQAQKLTSLYLQRLLGKVGDINSNLKGTCLIIRPDDVIRIDDSGDFADFGGTYNALVDEVNINSDCSLSIRGIVNSSDIPLQDWVDVAATAITVAADTTTGAYSVVTVGRDSPGSTNLPNALPGRLRIGQTSNYIVLDPTLMKIALYSSNVERMRQGNLNGFLGYVTDLYGIAIGDASNYLKYDTTNGLRIAGSISASTIDIGGADATSFHVDVNGNMWLGAATYNISTNPFAVSNAGLIRAVSGTIGGFTLDSTEGLYAGSGATRVQMKAGAGFWAGATLQGSAPFRVLETGGLTATLGYIGGWIITSTNLNSKNEKILLNSDSEKITINNATYGQSGIQLEYNTGTPRFYVGDGVNAYIKYDGTKIEWKGANSTLDASGNITATGGTIGGFTLSSTALYAGSVATRIQLDTTSGVHLGATAFADSPFRVSLAGALTATSATITGMITGSYVYGSSLMTKGTYLSSTCNAADATLNVGSTADFAASGSASFIDSTNDRDAFTYTGKTGTTLTGCSGVLAHTISATNRVLVVPAVKGLYLSDAVNELRIWGDEDGVGTITEILSLGNITNVNDPIINIGSQTNKHYGILGKAKNNTVYSAISYAVSASPSAVSVQVLTQSGNVTSPEAMYIGALRGTIATDTGTCTYLTGIRMLVGHYADACTPGVTSYARGLHIMPMKILGTISDFRAIYLETPTAGGTITAYYTVYQEDAAAKNFWAGYHLAKGGIRVGTTDTDPGDNNFYVEGTCDIVGISTFTGLIKTVGGLHVGGTSDPGADNLIVDGTIHVDGVATLDGGLKAVGAETLKIWTYAYTVTAADIIAGHSHVTITAVTIAKVRGMYLTFNNVSIGGGTLYSETAAFLSSYLYNGACFYTESTTSLQVRFGAGAEEGDILNITIIEAV